MSKRVNIQTYVASRRAAGLPVTTAYINRVAGALKGKGKQVVGVKAALRALNTPAPFTV